VVIIQLSFVIMIAKVNSVKQNCSFINFHLIFIVATVIQSQYKRKRNNWQGTGKNRTLCNVYFYETSQKVMLCYTYKKHNVEIKTNSTSNSLVLKGSLHNLYLIIDHFVIVLDEISDSLTDHIDRRNRITGNHLRNRKELIDYKISIEFFFLRYFI